MKRPLHRSAITSPVQRSVAAVSSSAFWHDRLSLGLMIASLAASALTFILLVPLVRPGLPGAERYSSLDGGYTLGVWYFPYIVASYVLALIIINAVLAVVAYRKSRLASFSLLVGGLSATVFGLVISTALAAAR